MRTVLVWLLRAYRFAISPLYGQVCRYYPTCSAYALEAVETHGAARGSWLAARRVCRCHPWAAGGVDPVPPRRGAQGTPEDEQHPSEPPVASATVTPTPGEPCSTS
ncbi:MULTISPECIES: membrane protein insertion efficiency factor YidD [Aeromicrobium]|uniref:membrane protein insertion efficiency factor YidD n=1 Tax=Aeromicrobium TaxID=2040 RepID=UPI0009F90F4E|nr:membrane protein insertion efficiency factor YidD [Aeromicrobium sp. REDSEA-S32_B7]